MDSSEVLAYYEKGPSYDGATCTVEISNSDYDGVDVDAGDTVDVTCNAGYTGGGSLTCDDDGSYGTESCDDIDGCGASVTCYLSIDNDIGGVYYGNDDVGWDTITDEISGYTWSTVYEFTFTDKGPEYHLKIHGWEWASCNGCSCSGIGMMCTSSDDSEWDDFGSKFDTEYWVRSGLARNGRI